jgi:hypothetical protein
LENDQRHLVGGGSEHALLGNIANEFLTLRVDKELSEKTKPPYHSTVNKYVTRLSQNGIMVIYNKHDWLVITCIGNC